MFKTPRKSSRAFQAQVSLWDFDPTPRGIRVVNEFSMLPGILIGKVWKALLYKIKGPMGRTGGEIPLGPWRSPAESLKTETTLSI